MNGESLPKKLLSQATKFKFDVDYTALDFVTDVWSRSIGREQMLAIEERLSVAREVAGDSAEISVDCHMHYDLVPLLSYLKY